MPAGTTSTCVDKSVFPSCQDLSLPHLSRCLPLSLPFDHFASTSEFPGSRAARYISDPLIVQGPRSPRASPISWNEGNRSTYRRNISRVPLGENSLVSNYFPGGRRKATYSRVLDRRGTRECLFFFLKFAWSRFVAAKNHKNADAVDLLEIIGAWTT